MAPPKSQSGIGGVGCQGWGDRPSISAGPISAEMADPKKLGSLLARMAKRVSMGIDTVGCASGPCFAYMDIVTATKAQIALLAVAPRTAWIDDTAVPPKLAPILGLEYLGPGGADRARNHSLVVAR